MDLSPPPPPPPSPKENSWIRAWSSDDQLTFIAAVKKGVISAAHVYTLYRELPPPPLIPVGRVIGSCADAGIFFRGDSGPSEIKKKALTTFFSPQHILQKSKGYFQRKLSFSKVPEEVQHFPGGGGPTSFRGGGGCVRLLILYRNPYNFVIFLFPL